jgi:hypothetical protein
MELSLVLSIMTFQFVPGLLKQSNGSKLRPLHTNRDNFIVRTGKAVLLDFENCRRGTEEERKKEVKVLKNDFLNDSQRGAPRDGEDHQEGKYPIGI